MTKREKLQIIRAYKLFITYRGRTLETVYVKPSTVKQKIWERIQSEARTITGYNYDLTIITKNTFMFTCGYTISDLFNRFAYITPPKDYVISTADIYEWAKQYGVDIWKKRKNYLLKLIVGFLAQ